MADTIRRGVAAFLAICGVAALVLGGLYLRMSHHVQHLARVALQARNQHSATAWLAGGAACVIVAWLIRPRRGSR